MQKKVFLKPFFTVLFYLCWLQHAPGKLSNLEKKEPLLSVYNAQVDSERHNDPLLNL